MNNWFKYVEKKNENLRSNFTDFKYKTIQNFCGGGTSSNYIQESRQSLDNCKREKRQKTWGE